MNQLTIHRPLHTERLTLRPATPADATTTWNYRRQPAVAEWLTELPVDACAYAKAFVDPDRLATTIVVELDTIVIGDLMLRRRDGWAQTEVADLARNNEAELGWVFERDHTGHGYATEAVARLIDHCFNDLGVRRVTATCFADNTTSWRLMERVGMRREAHHRCDALHRSGTWHDTFIYARLAAHAEPSGSSDPNHHSIPQEQP